MTFGRVVLAGFIGGLLALVFGLAWKASQETGKSLQASLVDVPGEAQRVASDARTRVSDVRTKATEKATAGWQTVKDKEAAIAKHLPGRGDGTEMVEEAVLAEGEETAEAV